MTADQNTLLLNLLNRYGQPRAEPRLALLRAVVRNWGDLQSPPLEARACVEQWITFVLGQQT